LFQNTHEQEEEDDDDAPLAALVSNQKDAWLKPVLFDPETISLLHRHNIKNCKILHHHIQII
jgi:hypothetical protein